MPPVPAVQVTDLCYTYSQSAQFVIDIKDWTLNKGEGIFLYGPSGCGKSTLLNLLAGVLKPTAGEIRLLGEDFSKLKNRQRDKFRAQHIGVVFQQFNLIHYLSVLDNLLLATKFSGTRVNKDEISHLVTELQLSVDIFNRKASQLSVGQQQRVAIARALINKPELLIVDEPTSALDEDARDSFMQLLVSLTQTFGCTLIFVSHDKTLAKYFHTRVNFTELNQGVMPNVS
ncbi:ABC transporter ATP-binding protein [Glaciecola sp. 1036]|uniref:ABC transporter ATP-binding protein n=1 Tax=Alteromonadaceae TaxID=72275 RepID=UPI003D04F8A5